MEDDSEKNASSMLIRALSEASLYTPITAKLNPFTLPIPRRQTLSMAKRKNDNDSEEEEAVESEVEQKKPAQESIHAFATRLPLIHCTESKENWQKRVRAKGKETKDSQGKFTAQ